MSKINLEQLRIEIRNIQRWQPLYKLLKKELGMKGYWKLKPRGNPQKAYKHGWGRHVH